FFGSFLYQDKKERENHSLQCFSFAMQCFTLALWSAMACIAMHEGVTIVLQILRPYGAGSVVCCS
ncbi:MAG TPA: hypothetical protein P5139_04345, partial [Tenuifilum sp.]|nr:hypothetical protein [Tenuifilum sp.]HRR11220.1 hypothetical protein [Tenuifilum sp.]